MYLAGALSYDSFMKSMETYELVDIGSAEAEKLRIEQDEFKPKKRLEDATVTENVDNRTKEML